ASEQALHPNQAAASALLLTEELRNRQIHARESLSSFLQRPHSHFFAPIIVKRHKEDHRKITPAPPLDLFSRQCKCENERHDSDAYRDAPAREFTARCQTFPFIQLQRLTQLPGTKIQQQDFSGNGNQSERINRKNRSGL